MQAQCSAAACTSLILPEVTFRVTQDPVVGPGSYHGTDCQRRNCLMTSLALPASLSAT